MNGDQGGGYPGEVLRGTDGGLRGNQGEQHGESHQNRPGGTHGQQPETQPDQQRKVGNQQRRMHMHQGGDFDFQPRHGPAGAAISRVRACRRD
ncbi:Uncharacterised protein [Mycobacterium tuberculosis]|nr:Uncharacterised protein [Mycobacterium tuberculosis]